MGWFEETRVNSAANRLGKTESKMMIWGRGMFANNFAEGGIASRMFSPGGRRPWGKTKVGSARYKRNLEAIRRTTPKASGKIDKLMKRPLSTKGGGLFLPAAATALTVSPLFVGEGSLADRSWSAGANLASVAGWEVGASAGASAGAAMGSILGPVGTAIGAGIGYIAGGFFGGSMFEEATYATKRFLNKNVEAAKRQRTFQGWYGNTAAFDTQKAATMRQRSLQLMNTGMMSARSGLGQEGVMVHR